jgi:GNAT superfamily N-acetyltransferase
MKDLKIRKAIKDDASLILKFITELAIYEKAEHEVKTSEADIEKSIFNENSTVEALICEFNNEPVGFAVYFFNYSTWLGKSGLFLEDLYVSTASRGVGAGKALLKHLAGIAVEKDCGRFEWNVLDWNEPAIKFYQSIGANPQDEWIGYRMEGKAIKDLAES